MGSCCITENNVIQSAMPKKEEGRKSRLKSTRSSIYQINKENINDVYDLCGKISSGYYGVVEKACFKNDPSKFYAVKSISKSNLSQKNLKNLICEIQVLAKVDHPNIVKYYETYDDEQYFHVVMELCEGGELFERIVKRKRLKEKDAAEILFKLTHAISHCHSRGIVHRDMKAENVLFETCSDNKNDVKIIDFGLARKRGDHNLHSIVGTPCYVAPEVLEGTYDKKCDIWALGILFYVMLFGKYPFDDENKSVLFEKIKTSEPKYENNFGISNEALNVLKLLLSKDPSKRPDSTKLLDDPWFGKLLKDEFHDNIKDLELIPRLKNYHTPNPFIKKVLTFLIKEIDIPEVEYLRKKFYILDEKKNGIVDIEKYQSHIDPNIIHAYNETINKQRNNELMEDKEKNFNEETNLFKDCLLNKCMKPENQDNNMKSTLSSNHINGKIDYTNFLAANLRDKNLISKNTLRQVFNRFDVDNQGYMTTVGFHKALRRTGKKITEEEVEKMLKEAGFDKVELITFDDFYHIMGEFLWD